jgi:hypothetical protein
MTYRRIHHLRARRTGTEDCHSQHHEHAHHISDSSEHRDDLVLGALVRWQFAEVLGSGAFPKD